MFHLTVAIAYVMQKAPYVFPIIGGRKVEHLHQNLEALDIALTPEHIQYLESILPFDIGFPASRFVRSPLSQRWDNETDTFRRDLRPNITSCTRALVLSTSGLLYKPFVLPRTEIRTEQSAFG